MTSRLSPSRRSLKFGLLASSTAALAILSGPIQAQIIPALPTTRTWDNGGVGTGAGTFLWDVPANWSADTLPGVNDIASMSLNLTGAQTIDLGGGTREIGALFFSVNSGANYIFSNGTLVTNSFLQSQDDANALNSTTLIRSKNGGADVIDVSVSSNQLQFQGQVTSGGLNKYSASILRLGTSGTNFENAINGDITVYGGTLRASAGATAGVNNPLGGSGAIVIGAAGVTIELQAQIASGEYDFVRNIIAGDNNFTITNNNASGTDPGDPTMRVGVLELGNATTTVNSGSGFRTAFDALSIVPGATATRLQVNQVTTLHGLAGEASANFYKRGGSDLEVRSSTADFAGNVHIGESVARFVSAVDGVNPLGGAGTTVFFGNGYGLTGLAGGQTLQLRSNGALDFGSNLAFGPGVTIGTVDVNNAGTGSGQILQMGDVNLSNKTLRVTGGNHRLGLDNVTVDAGATANFETSGPDAFITGNLHLGVGAVFNKIGGQGVTLSADNSGTAQGNINLKTGTITASVTGSLGAGAITVGNPTPNTAGFFNDVSRLIYGAVGASAHTGGVDVTVFIGGVLDLNVTPAATDLFEVRADGRIQGNGAQLSALTVGDNLTLLPGAIVVHEQPGASTATVAGLSNDATVYYGIGGTANTVPTIGVGTPWRGISGDNAARLINGANAGTPAVISINGGDNDPATVEATFQSMSDVNLDLGTAAAGDGSYSWFSTAAGGEKVTVAIRGAVGTNAGLGLTPGGRVIFRDNAASTNLAAAVDKIIVQSGTFSVATLNALGGVPVEVQSGGGLDIGNVAGNILDGDVVIKGGGVLFLNDNQVLGGSGNITIEGGGKLDITGNAPATIFSGSSQAINFTGSGHTVRFAASNITDLDAKVPNEGVTYVVSSTGVTAAVIPGTNVNVTTNTQSAGITLENGTLTNDGTSRGFAGPLSLNDSDFRVVATRATTLAVIDAVSTSGNVQVGSATAIDGRDKTPNPERLSGLGLPDPYNGSPQVVFVGPFNVGGNVTAAATHLAFADPNTSIGGDLIFNGNVLYLDGGGPLSGGSSTRGGLTPRLTDTTGTNLVADNIIMGNYARTELSLIGAGPHVVTQPFVITGKVNPIDKRSFWVDRADSTTAGSVLFNDILLKPGAQLGFDENAMAVRANIRLEGDAGLMRNHDDYDFRNIQKEPGAPANVTLTVGETAAVWVDATESFSPGSNAALISTVDGTVDAGITLDLIRGQLFFEQGAVLNGTVRAQVAPVRGDAFVVSRSSGQTGNTTFMGSGEIQIGRSAALNGPEDFEMRATELASGGPQVHTVAVPVRVVDDGSVNVDGIVRSNENNGSTVNGQVVLNTLHVDAGATVQLQSINRTRLTVNAINLGANSGIDTTDHTTTFIGEVNAGPNAIRISGPAQARITGDIIADGGVTVTGAGIDFDPGIGNTTTVTGPMALSGILSVRSGNLDLGTNVITGAAPQLMAGLREHKFQGAPVNFDETAPNTSNEVKLGPVFANTATINGWGENQTVTYTGQIFIPDNGTPADGMGSVAFAKWFDDQMRIQIDGNTVLRSTAFNDGVASGAITVAAGWHDFEVRLGQGTGGAGPVNLEGNVFNLGLGIDLTDPVSNQTAAGVGIVLNGVHYVAPLDDGSMTLFRTTTLKSNITVAANSNLTAGGFTTIGTVTLGGGTNNLIVTGPGASTTDNFNMAAGSTVTLNVAQASGSVTTGSMASLGNLTKQGPGTLTVTGSHNLANGTIFLLEEGTVNLQGSGAGTGSIQVENGILNVTGSVSGAVTVFGGVLTGNSSGPGTGQIAGLTQLSGGTVAPNLTGPGEMFLAGGLLFDGADYAVDLGGTFPGTGYDALNVIGPVTLATNVPLTINLSFLPTTGDKFTIVSNDGVDAIAGLGRLTVDGSPVFEGETFFVDGVHQFELSYIGGDGNDVELTYLVPEPGSAVLLLGGMGLLCGSRRRRQA